ncbi:cadherin-like beta sandwich domain-containing protein [candidate division WOR-3 bacterium]|nr:cadherin-like beta sandwich domain-containing protein [candidate division WOR-3 bacterium]
MKWNCKCLVIIFMSMSCSIFDAGDSLKGSASLSSITVMFNEVEGIFYPPFSPDITEYSVSLSTFPRSISLVATSENGLATIQVNGELVESGEEIQVQTSPPNFVVEIIVVSENGKNSKTYELNISAGPLPLGE